MDRSEVSRVFGNLGEGEQEGRIREHSGGGRVRPVSLHKVGHCGTHNSSRIHGRLEMSARIHARQLRLVHILLQRFVAASGHRLVDEPRAVEGAAIRESESHLFTLPKEVLQWARAGRHKRHRATRELGLQHVARIRLPRWDGWVLGISRVVGLRGPPEPVPILECSLRNCKVTLLQSTA